MLKSSSLWKLLWWDVIEFVCESCISDQPSHHNILSRVLDQELAWQCIVPGSRFQVPGGVCNRNCNMKNCWNVFSNNFVGQNSEAYYRTSVIKFLTVRVSSCIDEFSHLLYLSSTIQIFIEGIRDSHVVHMYHFIKMELTMQNKKIQIRSFWWKSGGCPLVWNGWIPTWLNILFKCILSLTSDFPLSERRLFERPYKVCLPK